MLERDGLFEYKFAGVVLSQEKLERHELMDIEDSFNNELDNVSHGAFAGRITIMDLVLSTTPTAKE